MPSNSSKSTSIRPRDDGLKPIIVKSEVEVPQKEVHRPH